MEPDGRSVCGAEMTDEQLFIGKGAHDLEPWVQTAFVGRPEIPDRPHENLWHTWRTARQEWWDSIDNMKAAHGKMVEAEEALRKVGEITVC